MDASGVPHIGAISGRQLNYARLVDGETWHVETVDSSAYAGRAPSLAMDGEDYAHMTYNGSLGLQHVYEDAAGWHLETIAWGGESSLSVNEVGDPNVSYAGGVRYPSLALGGEGYPRICYYDSSADHLRYAYRDTGEWHLEIVDDEGDVGQRCSLALDEGGHPHISYYDRGGFASSPYEYRQDLKYAHWDGADWQIETIDSEGDVGYYSSLALDGAGFPHIGYYDTSHQDLKYAYFFSDELQVPVDVKPHSCPNVPNVQVQGRLPAAILGTESFDISWVDPASVRLEGTAPLTWSVADVATPYVPFVGKEEPTDCIDAGPDGFPDLKLKFAVPELVAALVEVADGDALVVRLIGTLKDEFGGTPIVGEDAILILKRGKP